MEGKLRINGKEYVGRTLSFDGSNIFINDKLVELDKEVTKIQVIIEGTIESVTNMGSMKIRGDCKSVVNNSSLILNGDCENLENFGTIDC